MNNIYVVRGTEQAGPFTESDIRAQLASGTLTSDSLVWWDGLPEWTPLANSPLAALLAPAAPVAGFVSAPAPAPGVVIAPVTGTPKNSTLALVSMILGIAGLPMMLCWIIGLPLQIGAVITGHLARREIKKNPGIPGSGMALAGLILGYVGITLMIIFLVVYFAFIGAAVSQSLKNGQWNFTTPTTNAAPANP
jgi:hypothetical protein